MAPSSTPQQLLGQIKAIYDDGGKQQQEQATTGKLLTQAKVALAQSGLLVPSSSASASKKDLEAARDILSYGALLSVRSKDVSQFDRFLAQLKPFWNTDLG